MTRPASPPAAGPLGNVVFRRLMASTLVAYGARFLDTTMLSWLVVQRTDDPLPVALLTFFGFVPYLVVGPSVGFIADRFPRLRVVRWAQVGLALLALCMAALLFAGAFEVWHAYVYSLCQGTLLVLDVTSRRSYMAGTVRASDVTAALSVDMLVMTVARIAFANTSGLLLDASRPRYAYVALAAMAATSVVLTWGLPMLYRGSEGQRRESLLASLKGGIRFARAHRPVLGGLLLVALANLTAFSYEPMVPSIAGDLFHASPAVFGLFASATAVGSLVSSLWMSFSGRRLARPGLVALAAAAGLHALQFAFSYADTVVPSLVLLAVIGAVGIVFSISHTSLFLLAAPDGLRGRLLGLQMLMIGAYPVCTLIVGWLGHRLGALAAVRTMALAGVVWLVALTVLVPELRQRVGRRDGEEA
jgi:MFS family permease